MLYMQACQSRLRQRRRRQQSVSEPVPFKPWKRSTPCSLHHVPHFSLVTCASMNEADCKSRCCPADFGLEPHCQACAYAKQPNNFVADALDYGISLQQSFFRLVDRSEGCKSRLRQRRKRHESVSEPAQFNPSKNVNCSLHHLHHFFLPLALA